MNSNSLRALRGQLLREVITLLFFAGLMLQSATAVAPDWWSTRGVLKSGAVVDDYAALNQGQLKNLVRAAVDEMEGKLYYGAGDQARALLDNWRSQSNNAVDDYAAVTVGQLKAVALPLYQALQDAGMPLPMPWTETTADDDDYALATLGQAKKVFSFRVPDLYGMGEVDSDGDGFSDAVEIAMSSNPFSASSLPSTVVAYASSGGSSSGPVPANNTTFYDTPVLVGESKGMSRFREGYRGEQTKTNRYKQQKWEWDFYFSNPDTNVKGSRTWTYDPTTGNTSDSGEDTSIVSNYLEYGSGPWIIQSDTVKTTDNSGLGAPPGRISKLTETLSDAYTQSDLVSGVEANLAFSGTFNQASWASGPEASYLKQFNDNGVQSADFYGVTRCQYKWKIQAGDPRTVVWTVSFTPTGSQQPSKVSPMFWNPASGGGANPQESPVHTIDPRYSPYLNDGNGSYSLKRIHADLDVYSMVDGVQKYDLDDAYEDAVGAFVPVNKDDDDDDGSADKDQSGASPRTPGGQWVNGQWQALNWGHNATDTDLLPIMTRGDGTLAGTGVKYHLDIPSQIRVWRNPDRSDEVTAASADIDAHRNVPLFVEGVTAGTCVLKMGIYKDGNVVVAEADSVKITAFDWAGPCNVPGYSIHQYTATGVPATAKWLPPPNGAINKYSSTGDVNIHWSAGPVVGQARLYVSPEYTWPLEVNVVQVDIDFANGNSLNYIPNPIQGSNWRTILSANFPPQKAMEAHLNVAQLQGPQVGPSTRGENHIALGFMQTANFRAWHGLYVNAKNQKTMEQYSTLENSGDHIDYINSGPWQDVLNTLGRQSYRPPNVGFSATYSFYTHDTPALPVIRDIQLQPNFIIARFDLIVDFRLYLAVSTTDIENNANKHYTQRAATFWRFDGSGPLSPGTVWSQSGSGTSGASKFWEVFSGAEVPDTASITINNTPPSWNQR